MMMGEHNTSAHLLQIATSLKGCWLPNAAYNPSDLYGIQGLIASIPKVSSDNAGDLLGLTRMIAVVDFQRHLQDGSADCRVGPIPDWGPRAAGVSSH